MPLAKHKSGLAWILGGAAGLLIGALGATLLAPRGQAPPTPAAAVAEAAPVKKATKGKK